MTPGTDASAVELRLEDSGSDAARRCHAQYFAELAERFEEGFDPADAAYAGRNGASARVRTAVAWKGAEAVGCGTVVIGENAIGEVKRMWVAPAARGIGVAGRILAFLEDVARREGVVTLRLDTNRALSEARAFYRRSGYSEIARYSDNPYAHHWFAKDL